MLSVIFFVIVCLFSSCHCMSFLPIPFSDGDIVTAKNPASEKYGSRGKLIGRLSLPTPDDDEMWKVKWEIMGNPVKRGYLFKYDKETSISAKEIEKLAEVNGLFPEAGWSLTAHQNFWKGDRAFNGAASAYGSASPETFSGKAWAELQRSILPASPSSPGSSLSTVIVGGGPAGLIAAWQAYQSGQSPDKIQVLEMRLETGYVRRNLVLTPEGQPKFKYSDPDHLTFRRPKERDEILTDPEMKWMFGLGKVIHALDNLRIPQDGKSLVPTRELGVKNKPLLSLFMLGGDVARNGRLWTQLRHFETFMVSFLF